MNLPNFTPDQYVDATSFNTAFGAVSGSTALLASGTTIPGLVSPQSASFPATGLSVTVNLPAPFGVIFGNGVYSQAHGIVDGADTQTYSVSFSGVVPATGTTTGYCLAQYANVQANPIAITGPPPGHPDYNPNFVATTAYQTIVDSLSIYVANTPADNFNSFEIFRVTLAAGATGTGTRNLAFQNRRTPAQTWRITPDSTPSAVAAEQYNLLLASGTWTLPTASGSNGQILGLMADVSGAVSVRVSGSDAILGMPGAGTAGVTGFLMAAGSSVQVTAMNGFWAVTAGSSEGLGISSVSSSQVGAFINKIRNATCQIAARGSTVVVPAGSGLLYTLDGHMVSCTGTNISAIQTAKTGTVVRSNFGISLVGGSGTTGTKHCLPIESFDISPLAGRSVLFQCKVLNVNATPFTPTLTIKHPPSADSWATSVTDVSAVALQTCPTSSVVTQLSWTGTLATGATFGLSLTIDYGNALTGSSTITVFDFDLREYQQLGGGFPVPELRPYFIELLQSQRFLPSLQPGANSAIAIGAMQNTTQADVTIVYGTPSRVAPTSLVVSSAAHFSLTFSGINNNCTSVTFNNAGIYGANVLMADTVSGTGHAYTANSATQVSTQSAAASLYFLGAEITGAAL